MIYKTTNWFIVLKVFLFFLAKYFACPRGTAISGATGPPWNFCFCLSNS